VEQIVAHPLPGQVKVGSSLARLRKRAAEAKATAAAA
jgi:hypothetical protein